MLINKIDLSTVGSTNTWAKEHIQEFDVEALTVITAEEQTAGRGRFKRMWVSPKGGSLYVTYVFFIKNLELSLGNLPQLLALSAYKVIPKGINIKWPNDLVIGEKKLGGILCEIVEAKERYAIVIGLGLNINLSISSLKIIDQPATTLTMELEEASRLKEKIHKTFAKDLFVFLKQGFNPFLNLFREALIHKKGELIKFSNFQQIILGTFEQVNDDGSLALIINGVLERQVSGELLI